MEPHICVTRPCPWSLPWARWIHSYHPICYKNNFTTIVPPVPETHKCSLNFHSFWPEFSSYFLFTMHADCCVHSNTITVFYTLQMLWIKFCWLLRIFPMQAAFYPQSLTELGLPNNVWCCIGYMTRVYLHFLFMSWVPHGLISSS